MRSEQTFLTASLGSPRVKPPHLVAFCSVSTLGHPSPEVPSEGSLLSYPERSVWPSPLLAALICFPFYNRLISQAVGFFKFIIGHNKKLQELDVKLSKHIVWAGRSDLVWTWRPQAGPTLSPAKNVYHWGAGVGGEEAGAQGPYLYNRG